MFRTCLALLPAVAVALSGCTMLGQPAKTHAESRPAKGAAAPSPRRLPADFRRVDAGGGSGEVLIRQQPAARSAKSLLAGSLKALAAYFDGCPRVVGAMADGEDREMQAIFEGRKAGQPVRGLALARVGERDGLTAVLVDDAQKLAASLPALTRACGPALPVAKPAGSAVKWQDVRFPDGSGTIKLPEGWRVTGAHQGMVSAVGPQGAVDLGLFMSVYTPRAASTLPARPPMVAPYGDPARAEQEIMPQVSTMLQQLGQPGRRWIRLIDRAPAAWEQGKGEFLHYEWERGGSERWQTVALVVMTPNGGATWTYYSSQVASPSDRFAQNLPVLQQCWASWKTDDRVFQQRLTSALNSMRACSRIIQEANAYRQDVFERSCLAWDHHIRDTWPVRDTATGAQHDTPNDKLRPLIAVLNKQEGYERYKEVPFQELNR